MLTYWETLIATRSNIAVNDSYAALWGKKSQNNYTVETYTGTLPTTLQTVAGYLESYKIYGNTVQDDTPTPENPIIPSGCGVRTENLFNVSDYSVGATNFITKRITLEPNTTYTMSSNCPLYNVGALIAIGNVGESFTTANNGVYPNHPITRTTAANGELVIGLRTNGSDYTPADYETMLNLGSTPLPYEPYGYKLPILSNSNPTNIYLGEVETTRRIKKLVLTGEEYWTKSKTYQGSFLAQIIVGIISENYTAYCSHLVFSTLSQYAKGKFCFNGGAIKNCNLWITEFDSDTTVNDFKSYLAAQYAAGTPVTVWYVLAEPEIAVVNEPLMKIGDYADTIDSTQTSAQIPTAARETTISWAGEGLAPSEVELVYKVKG